MKACFKFLLLFLMITVYSITFAEESQYSHQKLPDGTSVTEYGTSDAKVKQILRPDGTIETHATDANGKETITTQRPNGSIEVQTK